MGSIRIRAAVFDLEAGVERQVPLEPARSNATTCLPSPSFVPMSSGARTQPPGAGWGVRTETAIPVLPKNQSSHERSPGRSAPWPGASACRRSAAGDRAHEAAEPRLRAHSGPFQAASVGLTVSGCCAKFQPQRTLFRPKRADSGPQAGAFDTVRC